MSSKDEASVAEQFEQLPVAKSELSNKDVDMFAQSEQEQQEFAQDASVMAAHKEVAVKESSEAADDDYLDNPISTITALKHPELVEKAQDRYDQYME